MPKIEVPEEISHAAKGAIDKVLNDIYEPAKSEIGAMRVDLREQFIAYMKHSLEKCMYIRTLDSPDVDRHLGDLYVSSRFRWGSSERADDGVAGEVYAGHRVIISGKGGSGKTIFLKYLFLKVATEDIGGLPLLVELRKMNTERFETVSHLCRDTLSLASGMSDGVFKKLCQKGFFTFIFDGFDEVIRSKRQSVEMDLLDISRIFPRCKFVVAGRENTKFRTWEGFRNYKICNLNYKEVIDIVEKSNFESDLKEKACQELEAGDFYSANMTLLATPLLVTMLLLTFRRTSRLPKLLTNFYPQVFEALVYLHDSNKETFAREYSMGAEQFRRFFGIFCLISYLEERYEFSERELSVTLEKAISFGEHLDVLEGIRQVPLSAIKHDLWEASNLLIYDDGLYCFIHRSMQEFFAADSILTIGASKSQAILEEFAERESDNAFKFCFELSEASVFENYVSPKLTQIFQRIPISELTELEFYHELGLEYVINIHPYESGYCTCIVHHQNEDLLNFLSSIDLISEVKSGIRDTLRFLERSVNKRGFRVPKNIQLPSDSSIIFKVNQEGFMVVVSDERENKAPEKITSILVNEVKGMLQNFLDERLLEYFRYTQRKLISLENAHSSRSRSIEDILGGLMT